MPSYYNRIKGTLQATKLAKASDINLIQSSIQDAIASVITDMFGPSFMLGEAENDLTLVPTAIHTDQTNLSYDEDNQWISFYERYLRQPLFIEKSGIESITLHMKNDSNITTTVYAEIRDINYNLIKETNVKLEPTGSNEFQQVVFTFGLQSQGVGRYYFILKPIDISAADLALNGDETEYDTITSDMFCVRYDRDGNYEAGLEASYNGVDYLEAYLLEDELEYGDGDSAITHNTNFDLYFEHKFSSGNTYLINPGLAIVNGQKVYPIDTHVTIAGPSSLGDRTDLVILKQNGELEVLQGTVYNGTVKRPQTNNGLKIAYITSYKAENASWVCPTCHVTNDGTSSVCYNCGTTVNTKPPLVEQADDNGITRQRDVLERLRRLEKMISYEQEYNRPTRVKYTCTNDPILFDSENSPGDIPSFKDADSMYGFYTTEENEENIAKLNDGQYNPETYSWAIRHEHTNITYTQITEPGVLRIWDLINFSKKPETVKLGNNITIRLENSNGEGVPNVTIDVMIEGNNISWAGAFATNSNGNIRINPYSDTQLYKTGTYKITAMYNGTKVSATHYVINSDNAIPEDYGVGVNVLNMEQAVSALKNSTVQRVGQQLTSITIKIASLKLGSNSTINETLNQYEDPIKAINSGFLTNIITQTKKYTIKRRSVNVTVITGCNKNETKTRDLAEGAISGNDSFYFDNAEPDYVNGAFKIAKINNRDDGYSYGPTPLMHESGKVASDKKMYKVYDNTISMQSEYPVLNFHFDGGYVHSLTPYIKEFSNIEWFQIILFQNDYTFGQVKNSRLSYKKQLNDDSVFPNIYVSPKVQISSISKKDIQGNRILNDYYKFIVDKDIPKGNYSLFVYGKLIDGYHEGVIFVDEYNSPDQNIYGMATKCIGTCNPAHIYLETNDVTNNTWDLLIEYNANAYKATGIVISKAIPVQKDGYYIKAVSLDWNDNIPEGCDLQIQVSNDAGRNWVTARSKYITFTGEGSIFEWKVIMRGNGVDTPVFTFDKEKGYALKVTLHTVIGSYQGYDDYGRHYPTPIMDFTAMTYKVFGDPSITQKDFGEWEWARLFMDDPQRANEIQILISNGNTDNYPIYTSTNKIDDWNRNLFFHQSICGLTLDDFEHTSVDYSNYDPNLEDDEYNFRFKYDTEYAESIGSEIIGTYKNVMAFKNYPTVESPNFEAVKTYTSIQRKYLRSGYTKEHIYDGTKIIQAPFYGYKYLGPSDESKTYFNSDDDDSYDRQMVIAGMVFEDGLQIDDKFIDLTLNIFASMENTDNRPSDNSSQYAYENGEIKLVEKSDSENETYITYATNDSNNYYFPSKTFELVVSFNPYGLTDLDASYGKTYPINEKIYNNTFTSISIPLYDDFMGSTIYAIGIRAVDNPTASIGESNGALQEGDMIALADLQFSGHDRKMYWPAQNRYAWHKGGILDEQDETEQRSYASVVMYNKAFKRHVIFPLCDISGYEYNSTELGDISGTSMKKDETKDLDVESKDKSTVIIAEKVGWTLGSPLKYERPLNDNEDVHIEGDYMITKRPNKTDTNQIDTYTEYIDFPEMIFNFMQEPVVNEPLFYIDVDFTLDPYAWVRIEHWLESEVLDQDEINSIEDEDTLDMYTSVSNELVYKTAIDVDSSYAINPSYIKDGKIYTKTRGQIHAGDIVFEFYDTRDHTNSIPIETFTIPAWGRVQARANKINKETNSWFKIRNGGRVKRIVVRRKNPTGETQGLLRLHLYDIAMHRGKTVPAFGSQLQMRIYPQSEALSEDISIRKMGVVYRLA